MDNFEKSQQNKETELPSDQIEVAQMLINAKIEYEPTSLQKCII